MLILAANSSYMSMMRAYPGCDSSCRSMMIAYLGGRSSYRSMMRAYPGCQQQQQECDACLLWLPTAATGVDA